MDFSNKLSAQLKWMQLRLDPESGAILFRHPPCTAWTSRTQAGWLTCWPNPSKASNQPLRSNRQSFCCCQTGSMDVTTAPSIETRLPLLAAAIGAHIPGAQVRLFGSRARGNASPDSDIDLLITVPDIWLASHDRWLTLSELRRRLAMVDVSLDLLLFSEAEVAERQHWQSHVIGQAYREGQLLHGPL